jgi:hypothetical protein
MALGLPSIAQLDDNYRFEQTDHYYSIPTENIQPDPFQKRYRKYSEPEVTTVKGNVFLNLLRVLLC